MCLKQQKQEVLFFFAQHHDMGRTAVSTMRLKFWISWLSSLICS